MKSVASASFENAIISIQSIKNSDDLIVVDSNSTVIFLDKKTLAQNSTLKANAKQENIYNQAVAISSNGAYLALASNNAKEFKLFNLTTKKLLINSNKNKGGVSCVTIDPKNRYAISCGEDGSAYATDIKSSQLAFVLPRHIDTINDIAFNDNATLIATASFDFSIIIFDTTTMNQKAHLRGGHIEAVTKLLFLPNNQLLSIDKKNNAIIWDLHTFSIKNRLQGIHDDITKVILIENNFIALSSKLGYILLYDLLDFTLITYKYIKIDNPISSLSFDDETKILYIGSIKGELFVYNLYQDLDTITQLFGQKQYAKILTYSSKNPVLMYTQTYKNIDILWEQTLKQAKKYLEEDKKQEAINTCGNFLEITTKKQQFLKIQDEFREFGKFLQLIKQNKLQLAYSLAQQYQTFKGTKAFLEVEEQWKKISTLARNALEQKAPMEKIKELLAPYRGIAEKNIIIQDLLQNSLSFSRFKAFLGEKNYKLAFEYAKKYPYIKETKEYMALSSYADTLYIKATKAYQENDLITAIKTYRILSEFDDFKEEVSIIIKDIESRQLFHKAIIEENFIVAYTLLDTNSNLESSKDAKEMIALWEMDYASASECAMRANIDGIKNKMSKYLNIQTKYTAIATLASWCYITELNRAIKAKKEQKEIENGIKNFILYFGIIEQIEIFFSIFLQHYPSSKLKLESLPKGLFANWRPAMMVKSILE